MDNYQAWLNYVVAPLARGDESISKVRKEVESLDDQALARAWGDAHRNHDGLKCRVIEDEQWRRNNA